MPVIDTWPIGSSFRMQAVVTDIDGAYVNNATVTMSMEETDTGTAVAEVQDIALDYVTDSDGIYRGVVPYDAALVAGTRYTLTITAVQGTRQLQVDIIREAQVKRER